MRQLLFLLAMLWSLASWGQDTKDYTIQEKFVWHQLDVLDAETDELQQSFPEGGGVIIRANVKNQDYMVIGVGDFHTYNLTIINKVEDTPEKDIKIIMYQGGEKLEAGTYTANIFFVYDLSKNKDVPLFVRLAINGAPNIMKYSGIIKLED